MPGLRYLWDITNMHPKWRQKWHLHSSGGFPKRVSRVLGGWPQRSHPLAKGSQNMTSDSHMLLLAPKVSSRENTPSCQI